MFASKSFAPILLAIGVAVSTVAAQAADIREERVRFAPGTTSATIKGTIRGYRGVDYVLRASAGQRMVVTLRTSNGANYFNVLPPGSTGEAIFIGSTKGTRYAGTLPSTGDYRIRVYLMRSAARRNEVGRYTLTVGVTDAGAPAQRRWDARGTMPCSFGKPSYDRRCPWTVRRPGRAKAVIRVTKPDGSVRVLRFERGEFASGKAKLQYRPNGDTWLVNVNDREFYRFADAVITGG